jgi:hypothetical protein
LRVVSPRLFESSLAAIWSFGYFCTAASDPA